MEITLKLQRSVVERLILKASVTRQDVAQTVTSTFDDWFLSEPALAPVESLSDAELMPLTTLQMAEDQSERLSSLSATQRERELLDTELEALDALMQVHNQLLVYKSEALAEAVRRGLRPPLTN